MCAQYTDELEAMKQSVLDQARQVSTHGVKSLDLIPDAEHQQVIFRLELQSPLDRARFLSCFGGIEVGRAMYFRRPLPAAGHSVAA